MPRTPRLPDSWPLPHLWDAPWSTINEWYDRLVRLEAATVADGLVARIHSCHQEGRPSSPLEGWTCEHVQASWDDGGPAVDLVLHWTWPAMAGPDDMRMVDVEHTTMVDGFDASSPEVVARMATLYRWRKLPGATVPTAIAKLAKAWPKIPDNEVMIRFHPTLLPQSSCQPIGAGRDVLLALMGQHVLGSLPFGSHMGVNLPAHMGEGYVVEHDFGEGLGLLRIVTPTPLSDDEATRLIEWCTRVGHQNCGATTFEAYTTWLVSPGETWHRPQALPDLVEWLSEPVRTQYLDYRLNQVIPAVDAPARARVRL